MYRRTSNNLGVSSNNNHGTTPHDQGARGGGGYLRRPTTNFGGGLKRSNSGSNFGFRPSNLLNSGDRAQVSDSAKRNLCHSVTSARPIGAHFANRTAFSIKDPRTLSDKSYQITLSQNLTEFFLFMTERYKKCPLNLNEKSFRTPPSIKEFCTIFEWMYQFLNPNYRVKNINEEMPLIFKLLGYPFVINASTMKTINAGHSWPTLLGALHWLSELIYAGLMWDPDSLYAADEGESINPMEPQETLRKKIFNYNMQCYELSRHGHTLFDAMEQDVNDFILRSEAGENGLDQLHAENERLLEELKMLETSIPEHEKLSEECQRTELDLQKLVSYLTENSKFHVLKKAANGEMNQEIESFEQEIKELRREIDRKEVIISQQDISPAEVKRMAMAKHELHSKLKSLVAEAERLEKQQSKTEMQMYKDREKIDQKMTEFKQKSKNLFVSSKLSLDTNWMEYINVEFSPFDPKFTSHYKETLRPGIDLVLQLCNKAVHEAQSEIHKHEETIESLDEDVKMTEEEKQNFDAKIKETEDKIQALKQGKNSETERAKQEIQRLKLQFEELDNGKRMSCADKEKQMNILSKEKEEKVKKFKTEIESWTKMLKKESDLILDHQDFIQKGRTETNEMLENCQKIFS